VAGIPEETAESSEGSIPVRPDLFRIPAHHRAFALRVRGDSMSGRHLIEGDIVVCDADTEAQNGDIVAALIDHESTLKTLVHKNGTAWLRAENPAYPEFHPAAELTIQGVVFGVLRSRAV
jgi:repressor LexA